MCVGGWKRVGIDSQESQPSIQVDVERSRDSELAIFLALSHLWLTPRLN